MSSTERITLAEFIESSELRMTVEPAVSNPYMADAGPGSKHWTCALTCDGRSMIVPFTQGSAHRDAPTLADVLDCLASDAASVANTPDWREWMADMGYECVEAARTTHEVVARQAEELSSLLPDGAFDQLLWNIGRS